MKATFICICTCIVALVEATTGQVYGDDNYEVPGDDVKHYLRMHKRIIGGEESTPNQFPWMAEILALDPASNEYVQKCGGALIDSEWVLTSASCFVFNLGATRRVRLGEHNRLENSGTETDHRITYFHLHDRYFADQDYAYDIAIARISPPATLSRHVRIIDLPRLYEPVPQGKQCILSGWGTEDPSNYQEKSPVLRYVELPIVSYETCAAVNDKLPYSNVSVFSNICAGDLTSKTGCNGDGGGPLVCKNTNDKWIIQGIVSWGDVKCSANYYSVFTRVSSFIEWIEWKKTARPFQPPQECIDAHYFCEEWKTKGYCNPSYTWYAFIRERYCKKTCDACDVASK